MNIYNELEYAENLIKNGFSSYMSFGDIVILSKYYRFLENKERDIIKLVLDFCREHEPEFNENIHIENILRAVRQGRKFNLRIPKDVPITRNEIDKIRELKNYRYEKVAFTMLVVAKYRKITSINKELSPSRNYFTSNNKKNFLKLAHVSQRKGENIFYELYQKEYYEIIEKNNTYILTFTNIDDISDVHTLVTDMGNIISFYPPYCEVCGKELIKNSNSHKMCLNCYMESEKNRKKYWWRENSKKLAQ